MGSQQYHYKYSSYHNPPTKQLRRRETYILNTQTVSVYNLRLNMKEIQAIKMFLNNHKLIQSSGLILEYYLNSCDYGKEK